ncbi:hypothetical protein AVEN_107080-1 [Araneus ventricosus]|uniref:Uncharacterized protein n=1 Tax=Araneus ventricosus TaxID=182803 RepID=A0A4Y2P6W7_ARAVE|nr:hypothetical protein AVEN_107080-1 [Araneus ventricosus]
MSKNVFQKRLQNDRQVMFGYQKGESPDIWNESESVRSSKGVPLNALPPVSTCGNQLDGASSVFAVESEMWNAGHLDPSKIMEYTDILNRSEELSHSEGDLPVCEIRPLVSITTTEDVPGPSRVQNISEELSEVRSDLPVCETVLLFLPMLTPKVSLL